MKLIIGLGNPGKQFESTRHNAGFMMLDKLKETWNFPDFKLDKKFNAEMTEGTSAIPSEAGGSRNAAADKIILSKPHTFMNLSGEAVKSIVDFYKIPIEDIVVIHDDLDINLGEYKISTDVSAAGHNGVQSIIDILGTQNFKRIRIGIEGEEKRKNRGPIAGDVFVLQKFSNEEIEEIEKVATDVINDIFK